MMKWRGLHAEYQPDECDLMAQLSTREQFIVHTLKAFTDGEIQEAGRSDQPQTLCPVASASGLQTPGDEGSRTSPLIYTDPEDIPFGEEKPKRRPKTYAVAWTWRKHKIHKTKKRCEERLKVWKRWYERQGWTVTRLGSGYSARLAGEWHVIQLHEYDRETKERLL